MFASDNYAWKALFDVNSKSVESPFFTVLPGHIVQAQAFGFQDHVTRQDETERRVPQVACLQQVLFTEKVRGSIDAAISKGNCDCVINGTLDKYATAVEAYEELVIDGCSPAINACTNQMLINLPGVYRFVLNDANALGVVRIYIHDLLKDDFPWQSKLFIS